MHTLVRPAQPADFDAWKPLWDGYNAFYGREGPTVLPEAVTRTTWQRFFDPYEPMHVLVAEREGRLAGLVHYLLHRTTISLAPNIYLQDLFTAPETRGQGVGRALIEAVYERARAAGVKRVYWHTQAGNTAARQLYDRVAIDTGFVVYHQFIEQDSCAAGR
jgi:GNAT superfamily N-acetyltransferase